MAGLYLRDVQERDHARDVLIDVVRDEGASVVLRSEAMKALGSLDRLDAVRTLALDATLPGWVRATGAEVLPDDEAIPLFFSLARDADQELDLRKSIVDALARGADNRALEGLQTIAKDDASEELRAAAQQAISRIQARANQPGT